MAKDFYSTPGVTPVYNQGVLRTPTNGAWSAETIGASEQLFADLLEKDIVGGQVAQGFVGDVGTPLAHGATPGLYVKADTTDFNDAVAVLLLATDAHDGARAINPVIGGTIKTKVGALRALDDTKLDALAAALGGKHDSVLKTIKF